jgi:hypothetical protein
MGAASLLTMTLKGNGLRIAHRLTPARSTRSGRPQVTSGRGFIKGSGTQRLLPRREALWRQPSAGLPTGVVGRGRCRPIGPGGRRLGPGRRSGIRPPPHTAGTHLIGRPGVRPGVANQGDLGNLAPVSSSAGQGRSRLAPDDGCSPGSRVAPTGMRLGPGGRGWAGWTSRAEVRECIGLRAVTRAASMLRGDESTSTTSKPCSTR